MSSEARATGSGIVAALALVKVGVHLATAAVYGFFIDELYFLACGQHLAWGYVDFPPLTAFQAWLTRALFGDSAYSIRVFPALAGAGLVLLTGAITRRLGGGPFAQGLSALAVLVAPIYLILCSYLSMNSIEPLAWMGCAFLVIRIIQTGDVRLWTWFGLLSGIGLLNKHTMLVFGFALVAGLLLTPERRILFNRWFLLGGLVAFLVFLPNLIWEIQHGFPHQEVLANIRRNGRDLDVSFLQFWGLELLFLQPLAAPVWIAGLLGFLSVAELKPYRALGWAYLVTLGLLLLTPGSHKTYYLTPAYPMLLAAGGVLLERWLRAPRWRWAKAGYLGLLGVAGAALAPIALPALPPDTYLRYTQAIAIAQPKLENRTTGSALPQFFADRLGWPEMVETVARVYQSLPPEERAKTGIFANDFGQGGAIDFYGPRYGLPKAIGGHLNYWYWGPRGYTGESLIVLGDRRESVKRWFEEVIPMAEVGHPHAMHQEHFTIFLCRRPKGFETLASVWPRLKQWD